ncbi:MAG: hypothetical protein ACJAWC_003322 [Yoonia sp.]|jgi:hypothetical protein
MKMNSVVFQVTKLDYLVLMADAANTRFAASASAASINNQKIRSVPETPSFEDDDLLLDNVPI